MTTRFCGLRTNVDQASFGCQLLISQTTTKAMFKYLDISPQFLQMTVGDLNYKFPGVFTSYDAKDATKNIGRSSL